MDANQRYFYQQYVDQQMEKLLKQMRVIQAIREHDEKAKDEMIECEIEERIERNEG